MINFCLQAINHLKVEGCSAAAVALLELGADPNAGHGRESQVVS